MKPAGVAFLAGVLIAGMCHAGASGDSPVIQDFQKRVAAYLQLRKSAESKLPKLKSTASPEKISRHEHELARAVREARRNARQGDIFTPQIAMEITRLIALAAQPGDGNHIAQSLRHSEPVQLHPEINESYPERVPLQSTPPSLLEYLPKLPPEVEYRITGRDLVLLDTRADLIIDIIPGVFE